MSGTVARPPQNHTMITLTFWIYSRAYCTPEISTARWWNDDHVHRHFRTVRYGSMWTSWGFDSSFFSSIFFRWFFFWSVAIERVCRIKQQLVPFHFHPIHANSNFFFAAQRRPFPIVLGGRRLRFGLIYSNWITRRVSIQQIEMYKFQSTQEKHLTLIGYVCF